MLCVLTGKETVSLTKNVPVHIEARPLLKTLTEQINQYRLDTAEQKITEEGAAVKDVKLLAKQITRMLNERRVLKLVLAKDPKTVELLGNLVNGSL